MEKYVVTITRNFGSLGRPIAKRLSELLDIEYYDRDIVEAASKKMNLPVSVISDAEEKGSNFFRMLFPLGMESAERQEEVFLTQQKIINELVSKESCIIVGRCSDFILAEEKNAVHIYIYASYDNRLRNCIDSLNMKPDVAKRMMKDVDKARNAYHKQYAKYAMDDPNHKDILINSGLLGVEQTAQLLADMIRRKFQIPDIKSVK